MPSAANYQRFYAAAPGAAWEVVVSNAGHFQFLDGQSMLQQAVCAQVRRAPCAPQHVGLELAQQRFPGRIMFVLRCKVI